MTAQEPLPSADKDAAVEALRQKILALPPTDFCGHFSSDFNGNCMTCAREAARREDMAQAWDEGHRFTGYEPEPGENPYRTSVLPPADGRDQEGRA